MRSRLLVIVAALNAYRDPICIVALLAIAWLVARVGSPVPVTPGTFVLGVVLYALTAFALWLARRDTKYAEAERDRARLALEAEQRSQIAIVEMYARENLTTWQRGTRDELFEVCHRLEHELAHPHLAALLRKLSSDRDGTSFAEQAAADGEVPGQPRARHDLRAGDGASNATGAN